MTSTAGSQGMLRIIAAPLLSWACACLTRRTPAMQRQGGHALMSRVLASNSSTNIPFCRFSNDLQTATCLSWISTSSGISRPFRLTTKCALDFP